MRTLFKGREAGASAMLFISMFFLPVIFFLGGISFDISKYYLERREIQRVLDDAALYAYRYLPYSETAQTVAASYISDYPIVSPGEVQFDITSDTVQLRYSGSVQLQFGSFFGFPEGVPVGVLSQASGTPYDALLLLDVSSYQAPDVLTGTVRGNPADWPATQYFASNPKYQPDHDGDGLPDEVDPVLRTQQCFNPGFSSLKLSLIETYNFLASFSWNQIGVSVFPGNGAFSNDLRPVVPESEAGAPGVVQFRPYQGAFVRDDDCAASALNEVNAPQYNFPEGISAVSTWYPPQGGPQMISPVTGAYDPDYEPYLSVKEAIWAKASDRSQVQNIDDVLAAAFANLYSTGGIEERNMLSSQVFRTAVIFAGDVPRVSEGSVQERYPHPVVQTAIAQRLSQIRTFAMTQQEPIRLFYVVMNYPGAAVDLAAGMEALQAQFDGLNQDTNDKFKARALFLRDQTELREKLLALLTLDKKSAVLSR